MTHDGTPIVEVNQPIWFGHLDKGRSDKTDRYIHTYTHTHTDLDIMTTAAHQAAAVKMLIFLCFDK